MLKKSHYQINSLKK